MIKNVLFNYLGKFWSIISNFIFIPLYIKILGFENYSVISFTLIFSGLMAIMDSGITSTLSRELAKTNNIISQKKIFSSLETLYFIISFSAICILFFSSGLITKNFINNTQVELKEISLFLKIVSLDIGIQMLFKFYIGGLLGLEKQVKANILLISWGVLRNGLVLIPILIQDSLLVFAQWQALATISSMLVSLFILRKELFGDQHYIIKKIDWFSISKVSKFTLGMLLISIVAALNNQLDKIIISKYLPIETLGYYNIAVSLSMGLVMLTTPISTTILPRLTFYFSNNKLGNATLLFRNSFKFSAILVFSTLSFLVFFSQQIILLWTSNPVIAQNSGPILIFQAIAMSFLAIAIIPYNIAIANGYTKLNNIMGFASLFFTIPGYILCIKLYGPIGASYVFAIVQITVTVTYIYIILNRYLEKINYLIFLFSNIIKPIFISIASLYLLTKIYTIQPSNRLELSVFLICYFLIVIVTTTISCTGKKERRTLLLKMKNLKWRKNL